MFDVKGRRGAALPRGNGTTRRKRDEDITDIDTAIQHTSGTDEKRNSGRIINTNQKVKKAMKF
jgi:hypothetical protein